MTIIWNDSPQGSDAWLSVREGCITGSRAKDARDRLKNGAPGQKMLTYAMDKAREREGGQPLAQGQNTAMRIGQEQEPIARMKYEARTGELVQEVGFAHTADRKFGISVDGLVPPKGGIEVKAMVGSTSLFNALVDGDISEYRDQCLMAIWLLSLAWVDVVLWCPDLGLLRIVRVNRDEAEIEAFEADMLAFDKLVESYRAKLRMVLIEARGMEATDWTDEDPDAATAEPAPQVETVDRDLVPMF